MGYTQPAYTDEVEKVSRWTELILSQSVPKRNMFLSKGRCACADLFYRYAPEVILKR